MIPTARTDSAAGPQGPRSASKPKLTPGLKPRTRLKKGTIGMTRGGSMTISTMTHLEARSAAEITAEMPRPIVNGWARRDPRPPPLRSIARVTV